jgi:hypothetical protein
MKTKTGSLVAGVLLAAATLPAQAADEGWIYQFEIRADQIRFSMSGASEPPNCQSNENYRYVYTGSDADVRRLIVEAAQRGRYLAVYGSGKCEGGIEVAQKVNIGDND